MESKAGSNDYRPAGRRTETTRAAILMTTTSPAYVNDISASSYTTREEDEEDDDDDERCQKDFKGIVITRSECFLCIVYRVLLAAAKLWYALP